VCGDCGDAPGEGDLELEGGVQESALAEGVGIGVPTAVLALLGDGVVVAIVSLLQVRRLPGVALEEGVEVGGGVGEVVPDGFVGLVDGHAVVRGGGVAADVQGEARLVVSIAGRPDDALGGQRVGAHVVGVEAVVRGLLDGEASEAAEEV
jgi:hypothetical protein